MIDDDRSKEGNQVVNYVTNNVVSKKFTSRAKRSDLYINKRP